VSQSGRSSFSREVEEGGEQSEPDEGKLRRADFSVFQTPAKSNQRLGKFSLGFSSFLPLP